METTLRNRGTILTFMLPALVLYLGVVVLPLGISGAFSTLNWNGYGTSAFVGIQNYTDLFGAANDGFMLSVYNTLILTLLTLAIQLPVALLLALILAQGVKGEGLFRTIFFVPVILSSVVIGHLWRRIYDPIYGLLNSLINGINSLFGTVDPNQTAWLGDGSTALICVCIPIIWQWIGYHMLLMYAGAKGIPEELNEAARLEGAGPWAIATKVTIPLMAPIIRICVILAVIGSIKTFDLVFVLTNGGPAHASEVPSTLLVTTLFKKYMYGYGSAMAIFIVVACLVLTVVIQKVFRTKNHQY